ncbi:putative RHO1-GTP-binding protein of the rho subfamily of ras-like protein [Hygrophoropsis aurantiaca]|uniref:RHO1-GTP-binding protein of the rho subfamily of ras-like protein n=1 Tax=Hygrophoropsis aurantiaca TaxID=72124 RepID=A0ACB8A9B2_9AGAM|nr:putative RHO1-GTP-binding protein of the rho subfamily of ras-like protein [Hygrophoropsis aurantiaca]
MLGPWRSHNTTETRIGFTDGSQPNRQLHRSALYRKITIVGNGYSGKTSIVAKYASLYYPTKDINPTQPCTIEIPTYADGRLLELRIWDVHGGEFSRLTPLAYPNAHVILIIFAVNCLDSLDNVEEKWYPEVTHFCGNIHIVLVGNKIDLRTDTCSKSEFVSFEVGECVARHIGADYVECSAVTGSGIQAVFDMAAKRAMESQKVAQRHKRCVIV